MIVKSNQSKSSFEADDKDSPLEDQLMPVVVSLYSLRPWLLIAYSDRRTIFISQTLLKDFKTKIPETQLGSSAG